MYAKPMSAQDKMYQAEEDVRTMIAYHEIHNDKDRYKAAMKLAKEKKAALAKATGDMGKMNMDQYGKTRKRQMAKSKTSPYGYGAAA